MTDAITPSLPIEKEKDRDTAAQEKPSDAAPTEVPFGPHATEQGKRAVLAFRRDLPRLLRERPREWVAYHGDQQIGIARTALELYQECTRRGLPESDCIVHPIEPLPPDVVCLE
jgi:hypothetical protein